MPREQLELGEHRDGAGALLGVGRLGGMRQQARGAGGVTGGERELGVEHRRHALATDEQLGGLGVATGAGGQLDLHGAQRRIGARPDGEQQRLDLAGGAAAGRDVALRGQAATPRR